LTQRVQRKIKAIKFAQKTKKFAISNTENTEKVKTNIHHSAASRKSKPIAIYADICGSQCRSPEGKIIEPRTGFMLV